MLKRLVELTRQDVIDLVYYDPATGKCYWRVRGVQWFDDGGKGAQVTCNRWNGRNAGKEITHKHSQGYLYPGLLGTHVLLHRLIWFRQTGEWPDKIDHINGNVSDNRWENLRNVTQSENTKNAKRPKNNISGVVGVRKDKRYNSWVAAIGDGNGNKVNLGNFKTKEKAIAARKAAEIKYGYSPTHGRD